MAGRRKPEEVFTPRAHSLNDRMYIAREDLESALAKALSGQLHVIVHGESGSGKSWLYKRVVAAQSAEMLIADLANASRFKSITQEFDNLLNRRESAIKRGYDEEKSATLKVPLAEGGLKHVGHFELTSKEPFERCLEFLRKSAGKRKAVLVWDNFERLLGNEELIREAADLIALADNPDYAQYEVRIIIVGVPADIRSYIAASEHANTIANRLVEIPEVERLSKEQSQTLVTRGFRDELKYNIPDDVLEQVVEHVIWITDRIPQHLHEYCLELANIAEDNGGVLAASDLARADELWLSSALVQSYSIVEQHMNARHTAAGRRNQAIYAIGSCGRHDFTYTDIEAELRKEFPESTGGVTLNVTQTLQSLASGDNPLLVQTPKGNAYRLINPKLRMCIRTMLQKDPTGQRVEKRSFQAE